MGKVWDPQTPTVNCWVGLGVILTYGVKMTKLMVELSLNGPKWLFWIKNLYFNTKKLSE